MQQTASEHGGQCLSETYIKNSLPLKWQCASGHQWLAVPMYIRKGNWCRTCARIKRQTATEPREHTSRQRLTIEQIRQIASERGGLCLSDTYVNSRTPLLWQCAKKHQWQATSLYVKNGSWCRICYYDRLQEMQQLASQRGGECLSSVYVLSTTPLLTVRRFSNFESRTVKEQEKLVAALKSLEGMIEDSMFTTKIGKEFSYDQVEAAMAYESPEGEKAVLVT